MILGEVQAQRGEERDALRWRQISTDQFQLVYPDFYEQQAQSFANVLDTLYFYVGKSLKSYPPRHPFLFHTHSAYSNGMAALPSRRIELWTTAPQHGYAYPWMWQLAIHEWRHSVQYHAINQGLTRQLSMMFGEQVVAGLVNLLVPTWFMEGDAVVAETALAHMGRGEKAGFTMQFRAQLLEQEKYSLDKAILGSFKDFVSNEYVLGYHLVSHGRLLRDKDVWADVMKNTGCNFWKINLFSTGIKKYIGIGMKSFYEDMIDSLSRTWKAEEAFYHVDSSAKTVSPVCRRYKAYSSPRMLTKDSIYAYRSSFDSYPEIVLLVGGREKSVFSPGYIYNGHFDVHSSGKMIWTKHKNHPRWTQEGYADLFEMDIPSCKSRRLTYRQRLYSPTYFSGSQPLVAAISEDSLNRKQIVILDPHSGAYVYKSAFSSMNESYAHPEWSDDGSKIYVIKTSHLGQSIVVFDTCEAQEKEVRAPEFRTISSPKIWNNYLLYVAEYNERSQIYALDLSNPEKELMLLTSARFGVSEFDVMDSFLVYMDYTSKGYRLTGKQIDLSAGLSFDTKSTSKPLLSAIMREQEGFVLDQSTVGNRLFDSEPYSKLSHLFSIHSYTYPILPENLLEWSFDPSLSIFSRNLHGTSVFQGTWKYDLREQRNKFVFSYVYSGFFPKFSLIGGYRQRTMPFQESDTRRSSEWTENTLSLDVSIPFSWSRNNWNCHLALQGTSALYHISRKKGYVFDITNMEVLGVGMRFVNTQNKARKSLYPRWSQQFSAQYHVGLVKGNPDILSGNLLLIFPGVFRHHSFVLNPAFQRNSPSLYYYENQIPFPSGVVNLAPTNLCTFKSTYYFPLGYPDFRIGPLFYVKRVYAGLFYDVGFFDRRMLDSYGGEFRTDFHIFAIEMPLHVVFRGGYLSSMKKPFFRFGLMFNIA